MKRLFAVTIMALSLQSMAAGPKILVEEDPTLLTSTVQVVIRSGSSQDPKGKAGLTHLLADLILRGTKHRSRSKFQSEMERMGASLGVSASHDVIIFTGRVIREKTGQFLELLEDTLLNPALSAKEFKSLKTEAIADINDTKNNNMRLSGLTLRRELFAGTPLERPVSGSLSTVRAVTLTDVKKAYKERFKRGNFVFAAATPLKQEVLSKTFEKIWNAFPEGSTPRMASIEPKLPAKPTLFLVHKPHTSTGALILGQSGMTAQDGDRYTLSVGNFAFGAEPLVARLFRVVRSQLGWTYSVGSSYHAMGGLSYQRGLFVLSATPSVEYTVKTIQRLLSLWHDYLEGGLKGDELKLAQESLVNSYPFEFDSPEKRLWQRLYSYLYDVPVLSPEDYAKTINGVSNKKLIDALHKHHNGEGWLITLVADKNVIEKQLSEAQKDVPEAKRLTISKVLNPGQVIQ